MRDSEGEAMKQYVGIVRDHSGSMQGLTNAAMRDYNENIKAIKKAAAKEDMDTIVSTVICDSVVTRETVLASVEKVKPITSYRAGGGTPLFDSVGELITIMENLPDAKDPATHFLILAITDGYENASKDDGPWKYGLGTKIRALQGTDQWTFTFRVPYGSKRGLVRLGIPEGNILEWEQTEEGFRRATRDTVASTSSYFAVSSASGLRGQSFSSRTYYADLAGVGKTEVKGRMTNISSEVRIFPVHHESDVSSFVKGITGGTFKLGSAFYQLTKPEKAVQDYKLIVVRNKKDGSVYAGQSARDLLGIPVTGSIRLSPGDHGDWDIYIQSTSTNRKLVPGTNVLYWEHAAGRR